MIEMLPVTAPGVVGANFAMTEVFAPALIVTGTVNPLMLKPVPDALAAEIVTIAVPVFVKVMGTDPVLPSRRLPKATLAGLAESEPCVPVPVNATDGFELPPTMEMLPAATPVVVGENAAEKVVDWPAVKVNGVVIPVRLKPVPLAVTCVTVTLVLPVFKSVIV